MGETRVIKRYANRKLYDTRDSRYVTLEQISEMIRDGDDVKIVDNKSKEDLTSVTLAQIIFEEEKKQRSFLSLQTMRDLIQNGGDSFASLVTEAQRRMTSILPRRKDDAEPEPGLPADIQRAAFDADPPGEPDSDAQDTAMGKRGRDGMASLREFREWVQQTQHTIDEWQKRVDHRIRDMVGGISPFSGIQKDVDGLATRIAELEAKLTVLAHDENGPEFGSSAPASTQTAPATEDAPASTQATPATDDAPASTQATPATDDAPAPVDGESP